jgi:hypothetical protein
MSSSENPYILYYGTYLLCLTRVCLIYALHGEPSKGQRDMVISTKLIAIGPNAEQVV